MVGVVGQQGVNAAAGFYPKYTIGEKIADGTVHVIGIVASLIGFAFVYALGVNRLPVDLNMALIIYGVTVVGLFCFSAAYHMTPWPNARPLLRRLDQAAIFLKIAGSYTPIVFLIDTPFGYVMLALIWAAALLGAGAKLRAGGVLDGYSVVIYLALGWVSLLLLWPMFTSVPLLDAWLILAGGVVYSLGIVFHQWRGLKFQNAVWHGFVLAASVCHFSAIAHAAFATATMA